MASTTSTTEFGRRSKTSLSTICTLALLVGIGVAARWAWIDVPNFKPVCGLAPFAGYLFSRYSIAALVPVAILCISDRWLGGYQAGLQLAVYGCLTAPILLRPFARKAMVAVERGRVSGALQGSVILAGCALSSSVLFFVVTNFATWLVTPWYSQTAAGLSECYVAALPFMRYTIAGDLLCTGGLFGGYVVIRCIAVNVGTVRTKLCGQSVIY